mmetsp:Transcript_35402/g.60140  ORF Transcript_35402/g.60140 Transcript_35402/m.60140 type:complete len:322 (-) Transcript_35402:11-976(-)
MYSIIHTSFLPSFLPSFIIIHHHRTLSPFYLFLIRGTESKQSYGPFGILLRQSLCSFREYKSIEEGRVRCRRRGSVVENDVFPILGMKMVVPFFFVVGVVGLVGVGVGGCCCCRTRIIVIAILVGAVARRTCGCCFSSQIPLPVDAEPRLDLFRARGIFSFVLRRPSDHAAVGSGSSSVVAFAFVVYYHAAIPIASILLLLHLPLLLLLLLPYPTMKQKVLRTLFPPSHTHRKRQRVPRRIDPVSMKHVTNILVKVSPKRREDEDRIGILEDLTEALEEVRFEMELGVVFGGVEDSVDVEEEYGTGTGGEGCGGCGGGGEG